MYTPDQRRTAHSRHRDRLVLGLHTYMYRPRLERGRKSSSQRVRRDRNELGRMGMVIFFSSLMIGKQRT